MCKTQQRVEWLSVVVNKKTAVHKEHIKDFLLLIIQLHYFHKLELAPFRHNTFNCPNLSNVFMKINSLPGNEYSDKDISHSDTPTPAQYHCGLFSKAKFDDDEY